MNIRRARLWCLIIGSLVLASALVSCGGSDEESELTKVAYLKRADAVCRTTEKQQEEALKAYASNMASDEVLSEADQEEKVVLKVGLPPLRDQVEALRAIPVPEAEEGNIQNIYQELDEAIQKAEASPKLMLSPSENPFNEVEVQARKYGFKVCGAA
jgi:hypothetical protein